MSIPKIIHYCWFGKGEMPELNLKCMDSWRDKLPEYKIIRWDESNYDVNILPYTQQAYQNKKYAFVSDVARFHALFHYGGLYLDTDVEVLKPLGEFLKHDAFLGFETVKGVAPGLIFGSIKGHPIVKELLNAYNGRAFETQGILNQTTVVEYTTDMLISKGLKLNNKMQVIDGVYIYPKTYFCPLTYNSKKTDFSENTKTIHHYSASWLSEKERKRNTKLIWKIYKSILISIRSILKLLFGERGFQSIKIWIMKRLKKL